MSNLVFKFSAALVVRIVLGLAAISLLSFLYAKTQSFNQQQHNRIVAHLSQFKQLDATLNQDVIESRSHLLNNYDPIVRSLARLHAITACSALPWASSALPRLLAACAWDGSKANAAS